MRFEILLIVFILTINCMGSNAQDSTKIKFPESFKLGKQDFLKSVVFLKLKDNGYLRGTNIKDNPGVVRDKESMSIFIDDSTRKTLIKSIMKFMQMSSQRIRNRLRF